MHFTTSHLWWIETYQRRKKQLSKTRVSHNTCHLPWSKIYSLIISCICKTKSAFCEEWNEQSCCICWGVIWGPVVLRCVVQSFWGEMAQSRTQKPITATAQRICYTLASRCWCHYKYFFDERWCSGWKISFSIHWEKFNCTGRDFACGKPNTCLQIPASSDTIGWNKWAKERKMPHHTDLAWSAVQLWFVRLACEWWAWWLLFCSMNREYPWSTAVTSF